LTRSFCLSAISNRAFAILFVSAPLAIIHSPQERGLSSF
jgi:hypothetical protein